ncbi:MAG: tetratricopeptide repeat protein [Chloroflexi bacterium]|nr:tetratricopeptide repeat protein [Chloroflexota bacterium]
MPSNKTVFQDAIKKGHNAAWDRQWAKAIAEYKRASVEFPEDVTVHLSLAHALEESGQVENALHECRIAAKLQPHDPLPLMRVAKLQERLQHHSEAAGTYLAIAELYVSQKAMGKAVEVWQKAAALEPDRTDVHQRLAEVYEQGAHHSLAAKEFLALARIYHKRGDLPKAIGAVQQALKLDSQNSAAQQLNDQLTRGEQLPSQETMASPVDQAQKAALSRLAETLLEERPSGAKPDAAEGLRGGETPALSQAETDALIARAVDAQSQHRVAEAVEAYRKLLDAGVQRPEVKFNLGLLYFETMRYDDAITWLRETIADPNYALASHFALGQCYRARGDVDAAVEHFLQVTKIVDLGSVRREQADELISVYEGLAESYVAKGDREQAESFSRALEEFLTSKGWEDKVREVRHHLEALHDDGGQVSLAEVIKIPESDKVLESLALSQEYLRRGKFQAAGEECFRAIELAPTYLPAHVRLAEVLTKAGQLEDARVKYQTLAELTAARGDLHHAESFYRNLLKISPNDVGERSKLIDVLSRQGRVDAALEEYLELGAGYARAEQWDKAAEKFAEGLRLAARSGITGALAMNLRHQLAQARTRQGDLKNALLVYQELRQQSPEDERAHLYVIDLEFRLSLTTAALRDLEELIARYRTRNEPQKAVAVLEDLAQSHPTQVAPRAWLAQIYINIGEKDKAISALDALGELQLSMGQKQAAAATVRQIIAMHPLRVEEYKQLLQQIVG